MCFLKVNKRKFMLNSQKQGELLKTCIMMMFMQAALVIIMIRSIYCDWLALLPNFGEGENGFELFMAKFFTTTTVHLMTYRYFKNGLSLMKYINNHHEAFDHSQICFILAFSQVMVCFGLEFINIIILYSKPSVFLSINAFVTQQAVIALMSLYFIEIISVDRTFKLREILNDEHAPKITWRNRNHHFSERTNLQKVNRVIYVILRGLFVCFVFYFGPLLYLIVN